MLHNILHMPSLARENPWTLPLTHRQISLDLCWTGHMCTTGPPCPHSHAPTLMPPLPCPHSHAPTLMPPLPCPHSHAPTLMPPLPCPHSHAPTPMPPLPCPHSHAPTPMPPLPCPHSHAPTPMPPLPCPHSHAPTPMPPLSCTHGIHLDMAELSIKLNLLLLQFTVLRMHQLLIFQWIQQLPCVCAIKFPCSTVKSLEESESHSWKWISVSYRDIQDILFGMGGGRRGEERTASAPLNQSGSHPPRVLPISDWPSF